jgi:S1-C subfamily serine protease
MAGLRPGDIITRITGQAIRDLQQAIETISGLRPGTSVPIVASRRGEKSTLDTMVAKRPEHI